MWCRRKCFSYYYWYYARSMALLNCKIFISVKQKYELAMIFSLSPYFYFPTTLYYEEEDYFFRSCEFFIASNWSYCSPSARQYKCNSIPVKWLYSHTYLWYCTCCIKINCLRLKQFALNVDICLSAINFVCHKYPPTIQYYVCI